MGCKSFSYILILKTKSMKSTIHDPSVSEPVKQFQKLNLKSRSRKALLSMAVVGMLLTACKKNEEHGHDHTDGTHQHVDGEEHHHEHEAAAATQEEFTVGKDSVSPKATHNHQHENGEDHKH